jgi:hypothetical protein
VCLNLWAEFDAYLFEMALESEAGQRSTSSSPGGTIAGNPFFEYDEVSLHNKEWVMSAIECRDTGIAETKMRCRIQASIVLPLGRRPWNVQAAAPDYVTGGVDIDGSA